MSADRPVRDFLGALGRSWVKAPPTPPSASRAVRFLAALGRHPFDRSAPVKRVVFSNSGAVDDPEPMPPRTPTRRPTAPRRGA